MTALPYLDRIEKKVHAMGDLSALSVSDFEWDEEKEGVPILSG